MAKFTVSCGTLVVNPRGELLLCHVTDTPKWDIPKGMRDPGESELEAALRELREEAGLEFAAEAFRDLGPFEYRRDKRLHLYLVRSGPELDSLEHLHCSSYFPHHTTRCADTGNGWLPLGRARGGRQPVLAAHGRGPARYRLVGPLR